MPQQIRLLNRRQALRGAAATGLVWLAPSARACEFFASTLRVMHPWARASAPGETTAVVGFKLDEVKRDDRLVGLASPVCLGAELGGQWAKPVLDLPIAKGQELVLDESTTFVRLTGLQQVLEVGRSYPLQLMFEQGGLVNATLNVDYMRFG